MNILGIDPGRQKTGLAIVDEAGAIVWRAIVPSVELGATVEELLGKWPLARVALGDSTGSSLAACIIETLLETTKASAKLEIVNERDSTQEARPLYFAAHPPRGWKRFVPLGLQCPPEPIDDFAAVVLARRALGKVEG